MIATLDVIEIHDDIIRPPGPKYVVCVCPDLDLYIRINSRRHWPGSIQLPRVPNHLFLSHDSFLECGAVFEVDEYAILRSRRPDGLPVGRLDKSLVPSIMTEVRKSATLSKDDISAICECLGEVS